MKKKKEEEIVVKVEREEEKEETNHYHCKLIISPNINWKPKKKEERLTLDCRNTIRRTRHCTHSAHAVLILTNVIHYVSTQHSDL